MPNPLERIKHRLSPRVPHGPAILVLETGAPLIPNRYHAARVVLVVSTTPKEATATMNNHKPDNRKLRTPEVVDCVTCGLPAEITDRFTLGGAPGPVEHVKIVCVRSHRYTLPADIFPVSAGQSTRAPQGSHGNDNPLAVRR